jgi:hypothetical protein
MDNNRLHTQQLLPGLARHYHNTTVVLYLICFLLILIRIGNCAAEIELETMPDKQLSRSLQQALPPKSSCEWKHPSQDKTMGIEALVLASCVPKDHLTCKLENTSWRGHYFLPKSSLIRRLLRHRPVVCIAVEPQDCHDASHFQMVPFPKYPGSSALQIAQASDSATKGRRRGNYISDLSQPVLEEPVIQSLSIRQ